MTATTIKAQAKKWAEMFIADENAFTNDFLHTASEDIYSVHILNIIVELSQMYVNYLNGSITAEDARQRQVMILNKATA